MMSIAIPLYYRTLELVSKPILSIEEYQELYTIANYIEKTFDRVRDKNFHSKILILFSFYTISHS